MVNTSSLGSLTLTSPTASQPKPLNWVVTVTDRAKYDALFDSLNPINGKLPGFKVGSFILSQLNFVLSHSNSSHFIIKVKEVLVNSTLPLESLGKIWDLSDMDHDGALDRYEFTVVIKRFDRHFISCAEISTL